jgi:RimJ/RimL family protein N-acetyltransferase
VATTLETERLLLRPLTPDDLGALAALHAETSFWQYPLGRGQTRPETEAFFGRVLESYQSSDLGLEAVIDRRSTRLAGWAGLSVPSFLPEILPAVEVGWRLGSAWRGRGYATEAGAAWVQWGFEGLGLGEIVSIYEPANRSSGRVMEKLGFELARTAFVSSFGVEVLVTALAVDRWAELRSQSNWPMQAS